MIPHTSPHACEIGGDIGDTTEFTAEIGAYSFMVLSAGLYSDRILAPIRELCCNAYDAHVEVGTPDRPFEVHLPTTWEPTFSVKDYGPGLSDKDVREHCSRYFASSKRQSADQIGALGLGMKSPLAYASSYSIESRYNGEKTTYAVYINGEGSPVITRTLGPESTNEPNGITIGFPVMSADFYTFKERTRRALMYFPVCPIISGDNTATPYSKTYSLEGTGWKIRQTDFYAYMSGAYVIQGVVAYPLNVDQLPDLSLTARAIAKSNLDLFVPIGQVSVAPSREALGYDPDTVANLCTALESAANEMRDRIQAEFDAQSTVWAARTMKFSMERGTFKDVFAPLSKTQPFTYRGLVINTTIELPLIAGSTVGVSVLVQSARYTRRSTKMEVSWESLDYTNPLLPIIQQRHTKVILADMKRWKPVLQKYASLQHGQDSQTQHYVVFHAMDPKTPIVQGDLDAYLALMGYPEVVELTELVPVESSIHEATRPSYYKPRPKSVRLSFVGFPANDRPRNFSRLTWERAEIDIEAGGFYMPLNRFQVDAPNVRILNLDSILINAFSSGLMTNEEVARVYGFNAKEIEEVRNDGNWVNLFEHLRELVSNALFDPAQAEAQGVEEFLSTHPTVQSFYRSMWPNIRHQLLDGEFRQLFVRLGAARPNSNLKFLAALAGDLGLAATDRNGAADVAQQLDDHFHGLREEYPMLKLVMFSNLTTSYRNELVEYLNMCDNNRLANERQLQAA